MKTLRTIGVIVAATALSALLAGCYTQIASERGERDYGYSSDNNTGYSTNDQTGSDTTMADSSNYNENSYEQSRRDFYDECYSPSVYVGGGWYSPWWGYGFGYDPWYWGYYPSWYGWYGYPAYVGWFPVVSYYGGYYGHYGYGHRYGYGQTRTFGVTRTRSVAAYGTGAYRAPVMTRTTTTGAVGVTRSTASRPAVRSSQSASTSVSRGRAASVPGRQGAVRTAPRGNSRGAYSTAAPRSRYTPAARGGTHSVGRSYSPPASRGGSYAPSGGRGSSGGGHASSGGHASGGGRGRR